MEEEKIVAVGKVTVTEKTITIDHPPVDPAMALPKKEEEPSPEQEENSAPLAAEESDVPQDAQEEEEEPEETPEGAETAGEASEMEELPEEEASGIEELSDEEVASAEPEEAGEETAEEHPVTVRVVGVRFRSAGRIYYFAPGDFPVRRGSRVIVETAKGLDCGTAVSDPMDVPKKKIRSQVRRIQRMATEDDVKKLAVNRAHEREAYRVCAEKIRARGLDMKLIDAEYAFDGSKIMFYFTADGRVDFRDLVRDLAQVFRMRIELRQIGVRDETKILGGYGICGRPLCCHAYLTDFVPVSIKMAKEQSLSLNPAKISGVCGRLMCCLKNEEETYEELNKTLPRIGDEVQAADGLTGEVESVNVLRQRVRIIVEVNDEKELHEYEAKDLTILRRRKRGQAKPKFRRGEGAEVHLDGTRSGGPRQEERGQRAAVREAIDKSLKERQEQQDAGTASAPAAPEGSGSSDRPRNRRRRGGAKPGQNQGQGPKTAGGQGQSQNQNPNQGGAKPKQRPPKNQQPKGDGQTGAPAPGGAPRKSSHDKRRRRPGQGQGQNQNAPAPEKKDPS
jgi:cell fate regulator YaaT (PSP1 superfamily)